MAPARGVPASTHRSAPPIVPRLALLCPTFPWRALTRTDRCLPILTPIFCQRAVGSPTGMRLGYGRPAPSPNCFIALIALVPRARSSRLGASPGRPVYPVQTVCTRCLRIPVSPSFIVLDPAGRSVPRAHALGALGRAETLLAKPGRKPDPPLAPALDHTPVHSALRPPHLPTPNADSAQHDGLAPGPRFL